MFAQSDDAVGFDVAFDVAVDVNGARDVEAAFDFGAFTDDRFDFSAYAKDKAPYSIYFVGSTAAP